MTEAVIDWKARALELERELEKERACYQASQSLLGNKEQAMSELVRAMQAMLGDWERAVRHFRKTLGKFDRGAP